MQNHVNNLLLRSNLSADEAIGRIVRATSLRKYTGVLQNYVRQTTRALVSEGKQASKRSHAASDYFEGCLARKQVKYPKRGKFRKLVPLLRILDECLATNNIQGIRVLMTVLRIHEMLRPNKKLLDSGLVEFIDEHAGEILYRSFDIEAPIPDEVYKKDHRAPLRIVHDEMQAFPNFPWGEFQEWLWSHYDDDQALARECVRQPHLSASLFSKSSASSFIVPTQNGSKTLKSATGSGVADLELAWRTLQFDEYHHDGTHQPNADPAVKLAWGIIDQFNLASDLSYPERREMIKDPERLAAWLNENFRYSSITTVAIEASKDAKARFINKTGYPLNYPLQWLHEIAMAILRRIPGSFAHDHDAGFRSLNAYAGSARYLSGIDATAWTDWFPLAFQFFVVANYFGTQVALMWVKLMREPVQVILTYPDGRRELVLYRMNPGQAMGALFSWAAATLSHHKLIRFSYCRMLKDPFISYKNKCLFSCKRTKFPYWIIGDDQQGSNPVVQADYLYLSNLLGIRMSEQKCSTMIPEEGTYLAEFVHRKTLAGVEVTGLSPIVTINACASYEALVAFFRDSRQHDFPLNEDQILSDLLKDIKSLTRKDYIAKYGAKPIQASWINIGLRIPISLGGLRSDSLNWNSYVEPDFALAVMVSRITSTVSVYRSLAKRNREFTKDNEEKILLDLERLPDDLLKVEMSTVARYLRQNYASKMSLAACRHTANLIDTFLGRIQPILELASESDYSLVDLEAMKTFVFNSLEELRTIVGVPAYLAAEAERAVTRSTMYKLTRLIPGSDRAIWSRRIVKRLDDLKRSVQDHGWLFIEKKSRKNPNEELELFYSSLFAALPPDEGQ